MSEKIRDEFELWFEASYGFGLTKDDETTYSTPWVNDMFYAWQASRAAMVVDLPEKAALMSASSVYSSLDDAGVSYK